jgi:hypothetical protein
MEAGVIVATLEEHGIRSTFNGQTTSGFRAEAPGWVQVIVAEEDMPRAQALLDEVRDDEAEVNWSAVDVGEPEDSSNEHFTPKMMPIAVWAVIAMIVLVLLVF